MRSASGSPENKEDVLCYFLIITDAYMCRLTLSDTALLREELPPTLMELVRMKRTDHVS